MTESEGKYATCEKEALPVTLALEKVRGYLFSSIQFGIIADHQALQYAFQENDVHSTLERSLDFLTEYDFAIEYRAGRKTAGADYLSRISVERRPVEDGFDEADITCTVVKALNDNELEAQWATVFAYLLGNEITAWSDLRLKARRDAKQFIVSDRRLFSRC